MKTRSQLNILGIKDQSGHGQSASLLQSARLTIGVTILLFALVSGEAAVEQPDFCRRTAQAVLASCQAAAQSDYWLALGKCDNIADPDDCLITTIAGTFMGGVNGDKPGIIMKAHPAIGDFYRQEFSLANAEDFAETVSLTASVTVPAGTFHNCLKPKETTPLETDLLEYKFYAPGVGNVLTVDTRTGDREELVRIRHE